MKKQLFIWLLFILCTTMHAQNFETYFTTGSLRIDYIHTVNAKQELLSLDQLYHEPYWGGSKINLIDTFNYGNYKFEVLDSVTAIKIYSLDYSSLSGEWRFTNEAKSCWRSFSESVIFPFPKQTVVVNFYEREKNEEWKFLSKIIINPKRYDIIPQLKTPFPSVKIHYSGDPATKLDLVLLAEGYTPKEQQKFIADAHRFSEYLMKCAPFDKYRDEINVWAIPSVSAESGTDISGKGVYKNTIFDSHFYTFGSERYLNTENNVAVRNAAANAPYDQIYILVNTSKYGGAGIYNYYSICSSDNEHSDFVFTHEFGHAFAGLADEYYTSEVGTEDLYDVNYEPWEPNITSLVHFDQKWQKKLLPQTPIPTPQELKSQYPIGAYEGAGYMDKKLYRPSYDCSMKSIKYNAFCPVCIEAINKRMQFYIH